MEHLPNLFSGRIKNHFDTIEITDRNIIFSAQQNIIRQWKTIICILYTHVQFKSS